MDGQDLVQRDPAGKSCPAALYATDRAVKDRFAARVDDPELCKLGLVGLVRFAAVLAQSARESLRDDAVDRRCQEARLRAHVREARDGRSRVVRVQRREYEVARHRRLDRDARGLVVADLADEEHVGVGAEDRAQPAREGQPGLDVHLDLAEARDLVLDRILDRRDDALAVVQHVERRVERRSLAGAGWADGEHGAVRLPDRTREALFRIGAHPELAQPEAGAGAVHDAQHDLLAVRRRQDGDADVHRVAAVSNRHASVLGRAPLGDVQLCHHFQAAGNRRLERPRDRRELAHDAVDPGAHGKMPGLRLEMEVGRAFRDRTRDERVDGVDRRCARGDAAHVVEVRS